ncbi:MAG: copper chaperone PCu(A)C [Rhizobacter sp.]
MNRIQRRRGVLQTGLALALSSALPAARACEFFTTNLRITHPWTRATPEGASVAVVSMKFDEVTLTDRLVGVSTPVAERAELGGVDARPDVDFVIPEGRESLLHERGTFVRLIGLKHPLQIARTYPLTLVFERSGAIATDLSVDYMRFD